MDSGPVRVLIVADDPLARSGLAALLAGRPECTVVSQIASGVDWTGAPALYEPEVVLWDLGWDPGPDSEHLGQTEELAGLDDDLIPVVALLPEPFYATDVWAAGARGLLDRDVDPAILILRHSRHGGWPPRSCGRPQEWVGAYIRWPGSLGADGRGRVAPGDRIAGAAVAWADGGYHTGMSCEPSKVSKGRRS